MSCVLARVCVCVWGGGTYNFSVVVWGALFSVVCVFVCVCVCVGMYDAVYVYMQRSLVVLGIIINCTIIRAFILRECALCGVF